MSIYGSPPNDLGEVYVEASEMCFVQYLPIKLSGTGIRIPANLSWCNSLVRKVESYGLEEDDYLYLTAKHLWVGNNKGNRLGWHSDGFLTEDINYLWYDSIPTEFCVQEFTLTPDHTTSVKEMGLQATQGNIITYPNKHLLRLDQAVIHRVSPDEFEGMRTFVKLSVSKDKYNLKGNAHNGLFDYDWTMLPRSKSRNDPVGKA